VFQEGNYPPTVYRVVKDEEYCGEIKVALTFTPSVSDISPFKPYASIHATGTVELQKLYIPLSN
jgi:hypothetical protein